MVGDVLALNELFEVDLRRLLSPSEPRLIGETHALLDLLEATLAKELLD